MYVWGFASKIGTSPIVWTPTASAHAFGLHISAQERRKQVWTPNVFFFFLLTFFYN